MKLNSNNNNTENTTKITKNCKILASWYLKLPDVYAYAEFETLIQIILDSFAAFTVYRTIATWDLF